MSTGSTDGNTSVRDISRQQATLAAQLSPAISSMHHIDELLQWLSYAIVRNFNAQLVQCWVNQINQSGRLAVQLRTLVRQDTSFPEPLAVNEPMTLIAQRVMGERRSYKPQPVETLFPPYQTVLLKRYGMHYCGACFTSRNAFLPQTENELYQERSPVPLAMTTMLFLRQFSHPDLVPVVSSLFEQAVALAERRGLLSVQNVATPYFSPFASQFAQQSSPAVNQLIPRRKQDMDLMLSDNPFASNAVIADKHIRHFYAAIDGQTNVAELGESMGMTLKETYAVLRKLLQQSRIELYEASGQPVSNPLFPENL